MCCFQTHMAGLCEHFLFLGARLSFFAYPFFNKCYQLLTSLPESEYKFGLIGGLKDTRVEGSRVFLTSYCHK